MFDGVMENDYELGALDLASGRRGGSRTRRAGTTAARCRPTASGSRTCTRPTSGARCACCRSKAIAAASRMTARADGVGFSQRGRATARCSSERATRSCAVTIDTARRAQAWSGGCRRARSIATWRSSPTANMVALWQPQYAANDGRGRRAAARAAWRARSRRCRCDSIGLIGGAVAGGAISTGAITRTPTSWCGDASAAAPSAWRRDVTPASGLSISPDGKHLAYSTCRESAMIARLRPGKPPEPLMATGSWRDIWPAPVDARRLLFESDRAGAVQVWLLDRQDARGAAAGGGVVVASGGVARRQVVGVHRRRRARDPRGAGRRRRGARVTDDAADGEPTFAFDGKTIVFESTRDRGGRARVLRWRPAAGRCARSRRWGRTAPAASPTEDRVVFTMPTDKGRRADVDDARRRGSGGAVAGVAAGDWLNPRFLARREEAARWCARRPRSWRSSSRRGRRRSCDQAGLDGIGEVGVRAGRRRADRVGATVERRPVVGGRHVQVTVERAGPEMAKVPSQVIIRRAGPGDAEAIAGIQVRGSQAAYRGLMPQAYLDALTVVARVPAWLPQLAAESLRHTYVAERESARSSASSLRAGRGPDAGRRCRRALRDLRRTVAHR